MTPTEAQIQYDILRHFGSRPDMLIWRNNVGVGRTLQDDRVKRFGLPGSPDILGVLMIRDSDDLQRIPNHPPFGLALGIEVKTEHGRQSEKQQNFEDAFTKRGGIYVLARSIEDVEQAIGRT